MPHVSVSGVIVGGDLPRAGDSTFVREAAALAFVVKIKTRLVFSL